MIRKTEGFTLLELIISIAVGTMITIAATTTLLLGLRINAGSTENVKQQNTTSMLVQVLENIAEEQNIVVSGDHRSIAKEITAEETKTFVIFDESTKTLNLNGNVFMEDVDSFEAKFDDTNKLLTIRIETNNTPYTASIYCRLNPPVSNDDEDTEQDGEENENDTETNPVVPQLPSGGAT